MAQRPSFDMSKMSLADKILLGAGLLYVIDSFLPWQRACAGLGGVDFCVSRSLWAGVGIIAALAAIALVVVVGASVVASASMPALPPLAVPALAGAVLVFTILKIIIDNEALGFAAWIGLVLSLAIAYGGWLKMQATRATATGYTPPAPPAV